MKTKQPPLPKFPTLDVEAPPQVMDVYFELTEEQKKWPVMTVAKMVKADWKPATSPKPADQT